MTIREILDTVDREIAGNRAAILRLQGVKERILTACRDHEKEAASPPSAEEGPVCLKIGERAGTKAARRAA